MMSSYAESKKALDKIRSEYGCKGEVLFRTALQLVVSVGQCTFLDDAWYQREVDDVNAKHKYAILYVSRNFELAILECARKIAKIDSYDLLVYIQKEVYLSHEGGIDYDRAVTLLKACMSNIEQWNDCRNELTLGELEDIGFDDDEITELGFGYVLDAREEVEEDE